MSLRWAIALVTGWMLSSAAGAAVISGSFFDLVYDPTLVGLFGQPAISGSTVFFTPVNFKAESLNGTGVVTNNQTITFDIVPHAGVTVDSMNLLERGDYLLQGASSVVQVDGQTRGFAIANPFDEVTSPITATAPLDVVNSPNTVNWSATSFLDFTGMTANGSGYSITIENLLEAYTDPADSGIKRAFIEKKFAGESIGLTVSVESPVPEAQSWTMLLAGLFGLTVVARRRSR